ncbi:MAG TPA: discoidin domain-containing protein [Pirellulales bacterium]|nr:discoidin domain-containing protein [Pirellulales bacterium]
MKHANYCLVVLTLGSIALLANAPLARAADDEEADYEIHEMSLWGLDPTLEQANHLQHYPSSMPGVVETDRSRTGQPGRLSPFSLLTFHGQALKDLELDLRVQNGRFLGHWVAAESKSGRLRWIELITSAEPSESAKPANVDQKHWFNQARQLDGLHVSRGARSEKFLTYDCELKYAAAVKLAGGSDTYQVTNLTTTPLSELYIVVPDGDKRRIGRLETLAAGKPQPVTPPTAPAAQPGAVPGQPVAVPGQPVAAPAAPPPPVPVAAPAAAPAKAPVEKPATGDKKADDKDDPFAEDTADEKSTHGKKPDEKKPDAKEPDEKKAEGQDAPPDKKPAEPKPDAPPASEHKNLVVTAKHSASSEWDANFTAAKAFDGDGATRWNSRNLETQGAWVACRWAQPVTVYKVVVREAFDRIGGFKVQQFDAAKNDWVDAIALEGEALLTQKGDTSGNPNDGKANPTFTLDLPAPLVTTGIRILVTSVVEKYHGAVSLFEVEAYGTAPPPPPLPPEEPGTDVVMSPPMADDSAELAAIKESFAEGLRSGGLTAKEVELFMSMASKSIFGANEMVVVYRLPAAVIEERLPLVAYPAPRKTVRMALMVVRNIDPRIKDEVTRLVAELGADDYSQREKAEKRLAELGRLAVPALKTVLNNADPEVAYRAERILLAQNEKIDGT